MSENEAYPAGADRTGESPLNRNPGTNPGSFTPGSANPGITNPSGTNPSGTNPSGTNPSGTNPSGTNPSGTNPSGANPGSTNPGATTPGSFGTRSVTPGGYGPSTADPGRAASWSTYGQAERNPYGQTERNPYGHAERTPLPAPPAYAAGQTYPGYPPPYAPYYGTPQPSAATSPRPGRTRRVLVAGAAGLALALGGGAVGGLVGYSLHGADGPLQASGVTGNGNAAPVVDRSSLATIAASLQPAIVDIKTTDGEGSGVIISADGNIVTNNHVVAGASTVTVTFNSGRQISGRVIGTDDQFDIAVVKVDASDLVYAAWGDSDSVQVGDTVLAMGSPLGLQGTVTAGIVSSLHRTITTSDGEGRTDSGTTRTIGDAIQTDAPINAGNSGGALVDMRGEVVGINTAIATDGASSGNIGVGFAISANKAKAVAQALLSGQSVGHPYLGVQISDAPAGGATLESVVDGQAAAQAGLRAQDVVTKVDDREIHNADDLVGAIQASTVGQQLSVTFLRDGTEQTVTVTVGER